MEVRGVLSKMQAEPNNPIDYYWSSQSGLLHFNELIGKKLGLHFTGEIFCIKCGRKTKKSFSQGYCYPCFISAPETEECVLRPELCRAHEGIARDMEFAKEHCLIDHIVYLSRTDAIKVGVTRHTQVPTRWIDQGACEAIKLARTPNRYFAGCIESSLKRFLPDKTNWRNMLTGKITDTRELVEVKILMFTHLEIDLQKFFLPAENEVTTLSYPLPNVPEKIASVDFDKTPLLEGILTGVKGQYLIFDNINVINIRKYGGYAVKLCF
jgi:hypothetical protein